MRRGAHWYRCRRLNPSHPDDRDIYRPADLPDHPQRNRLYGRMEHGGIAFGQEPGMVEYITKEIKKKAAQPVSMKLTPNVTDITEIAKAAEAGGADALSLINTITGMRIDVKKRAFCVANKTGGLSGPAIKPVAFSGMA